MKDNKVNSGLLEFSEDQKVFVALDAETSEVKKAVTIDGDGVETDIQGVQPSGKKEITSTAEVNVANYATAQVVDVDLVAGNIKKDVDILGVVGSYEPEAPASDFSTVEVTLINNSIAKWVNISIPSIVDDDTPGNEFAAAIDYIHAEPGQTVVQRVVLYKGLAVGYIPFDVELTAAVTGNITLDQGRIDVSGDGSIIVSHSAPDPAT